MNRNQARAREHRAEVAKTLRIREEREYQESLRWEIAEGPVPAEMWGNSKVIASFARLPNDGICTKHVREYGQGHYLQYVDFPGWRFAVCIRKEER
jgi:hypothetical protein